MKHIILATVAGLTSFVVPTMAEAQAQPDAQIQAATQTPSQLLDTAIQNFERGAHDAAIDQVRQALVAATDPADQFDAHFTLAEMLAATENPAEAYEHFGEATTILETHFPDYLRLRSEVLAAQGYQAFLMGRREDWLRLTEQSQAMIRADLAILFRFEDNDAAQHRLSGYVCSPGVGKLLRTDFTVYMPSGRDVACVYQFEERDTVAITVHVSHQPGLTPQQAFDGADHAVRLNRAGADQLIRDQQEIAGLSVEHARYRQGSMQTAVYTSQVGDWTVKLRLTDYESRLTDAQWAEAAELTFSGAAAMARHASQCAALPTGGSLNPTTDMSLQLESLLGLSLSTPQEEDTPSRRADSHLDCLLGEPPFEPDGGIAYAEIAPDGSLVRLTAHPVSDRSIRVEAVPSTMLGRSGLRMSVAYPERTEFYGWYDQAPDAETFLADITRIFTGALPVASVLSRDENGDVTLSVTSAPE